MTAGLNGPLVDQDQHAVGTMLASGRAGYRTQATGGHMSANVQRAVFAYSYEVGGRPYTGHRAAFGTPLGFGMGLGGIAPAQAGRYEPGEAVDVWIDPADPSNAVLRRSAPPRWCSPCLAWRS